MEVPSVKIELTPQGYGSKVWIDGQEIHGVKRIQINATPQLSSISIEVYAKVELSGRSSVEIIETETQS